MGSSQDRANKGLFTVIPRVDQSAIVIQKEHHDLFDRASSSNCYRLVFIHPDVVEFGSKSDNAISQRAFIVGMEFPNNLEWFRLVDQIRQFAMRFNINDRRRSLEDSHP